MLSCKWITRITRIPLFLHRKLSKTHFSFISVTWNYNLYFLINRTRGWTQTHTQKHNKVQSAKKWPNTPGPSVNLFCTVQLHFCPLLISTIHAMGSSDTWTEGGPRSFLCLARPSIVCTAAHILYIGFTTLILHKYQENTQKRKGRNKYTHNFYLCSKWWLRPLELSWLNEALGVNQSIKFIL